jgi:hypothetical protein
MLTKSDYIRFTQCYKYLWLNKYHKDLLLDDVDSLNQKTFDEGYKVEQYAYELFPGGENASADDITDAITNTQLMIKNGRKIIFQPTVSDYKLFCRADIIRYNPRTKLWDIYEVKSSTEVDDTYLLDLAFQKICFEQCKINVGKMFVVHVNNKYVRQGAIEAEKLFKKTDVTDEVTDLLKQVKLDIKKANEVLNSTEEPKVKILNQCNKPYSCAFINHCWQHVPDNSIYEIAGGLADDKLEMLLEQGVFEIKDIPDDLLTRKSSIRHHQAVKHKKVFIDKTEIASEMAQIEYPIYFLDYETNNPAVPLFDGYKPYQRMVFQYSLHIKRSPKAKLEHYEYLADKLEEPSLGLVKALKKAIGPTGTVIAWNKSFEKGCNLEMGERHHEYADFLESVNERMYDLMDTFKKGYYVHHDFKGSASIKKVLPVLVPKLSYKKLNIQEGGTASDSWLKMIDGRMNKKDAAQTYKDLLKYCELDTLAMVEILEVLRKI